MTDSIQNNKLGTTTNAHGVTAPVRPHNPKKPQTDSDAQAQLKRLSEKHKKAFSLLANR